MTASSRRSTLAFLLVALGTLFASAATTWAGDQGETEKLPVDLAELSLEQLMTIVVTSVSRKEEPLSGVAAAISVISSEDIRRSGATTIAEALRLVPSLEVARIDAHTWAISARGFQSQFSNKLLVLIDGRSVYTPVYSGVYWDAQDTNLDDVDRIEVIRGPGATVWGANAVNGVINIITKRAKATQGVHATAGAGSEEIAFGSVRGGGTIVKDGHFRAYLKYANRDESVSPGGAHDGWWSGQSGFRIDWENPEESSFTFQSDMSRAELDQITTTPMLDPPFSETNRIERDITGWNLLGRWTRALSGTSGLTVQMYYDQTERRQIIIDELVRTFDIDTDHRFRWGDRQEIVWGLGYRLLNDHFPGSFVAIVDPLRRTTRLYSAFVQDEFALTPRRLSLTLGSKFEHNSYTGVEIQPSARLAWTPQESQSLWAAVSRAVRTPSRTEDDLRINALVTPGPTVFAVFGNRGTVAEELMAFELGYRAQPHDRHSFDVAAFYNVYDHLTSLEPGAAFLESSPPPQHTVFPFTIDNKLAGESYGAEVETRWQFRDWWRLHAGYAFLELDIRRVDGGQDPTFQRTPGRSPQHQASLRSSMDFPGRIELDIGMRYVDILSSLDIPSYVTGDVRVAWKPQERLEAAVVAQNLFDPRHPEYLNTQHTEVERSVYAKVTWGF